jgi:hypothetical protein
VAWEPPSVNNCPRKVPRQVGYGATHPIVNSTAHAEAHHLLRGYYLLTGEESVRSGVRCGLLLGWLLLKSLCTRSPSLFTLATVTLAPVDVASMSTTHSAVVNNGVTTSWIPFTTPGVSVSPAACSSEIYRVPGSQDIMAFDPYYAKNIQSGLRCLPAEVTQSWEQGTKNGVTTSLGGFQCPSLYTKAATASIDEISTIVACCPS